MSTKPLAHSALLFCMVTIMVYPASFAPAHAGDDKLPKACLDGTGSDWQSSGKDDFVTVNGEPDTWHFENGLIKTTGEPIGVIRSKKPFSNVEILVEWRFLEPGGNSGRFAWVPKKALYHIEPGELPDYGIEIRMLDPGFRKNTGNERARRETGLPRTVTSSRSASPN